MQIKEQFPDIAFGEVGKKLGGCCSALQRKRVCLKHMRKGELICWYNVFPAQPSSCGVHMPVKCQCALQAMEEAHGVPVALTFSLNCNALTKRKAWPWEGKLVALGKGPSK